MAHYHYGQNIPGYMPMSDEPNIVDTFDAAKRGLIDDMERDADSFGLDDEHSRIMGDEIAAAQQDVNLWSSADTIYVSDDSPGSHDLGMAYWITECDERDCVIAWLEQDGNKVPCSRYGRDSSECAPVAYALAEIAAEANGDEITLESVDFYMGLVVNDHDDVESLIVEHGTPAHRQLLDYNLYAAGAIPTPDTGSYHPFAVMDDGGVLCEHCVTDASNPVHPDDDQKDGWGVVGWSHSGETDQFTVCDHCSLVIVEQWEDDEEESELGRLLICTRHGAEECNDPDCIRERGGSVLAEELRQAEREIGII